MNVNNSNRSNRTWKIIRSHVSYWLNVPKPYDKEPYDKWIEIQSRLLSRFQEHWPNSHMFIRLHTYYYPEQLLNNIEYPQVERIVTSDPREFLLLFSDTNDPSVWKQVMETGIAEDYGRMFILFSHFPERWVEKATEIYRFIRSTDFEQKSPPNETIALSRYVCSSYDTSFVINNIDLSESDVMHELQRIANEERLIIEVNPK